LSALAATRVLITGATSGLGRAMAEALLKAGAAVAITGGNRDRAARVADELGAAAIGVELDVRDPTSVEHGIDEVYGHLGAVDLLVNNAGIGMRTVNPRFMTDPQPFWNVSPRGFADVVDTKLAGTFLVSRAVVPRMLQMEGGRVVTISMNEATMSRRGFVPYGPSGAGVEALAHVMAADLEDSAVRSNILLPGGATLTGMIPDDLPGQARANLLDPAVMGPPIVWLASEAASDVHGERMVAAEFSAWLESRGPQAAGQ
jgi:NAD(P)-dependent dehydrogenase (short-subunit alcohol dehydrogenase family)